MHGNLKNIYQYPMGKNMQTIGKPDELIVLELNYFMH